MKIQKVPLIIVSILLVLFAVIYFYKGARDKEIFQLTIESPQKVLQKGDKVTFKARLTNLTNKEYTLYHGVPLISLYIRQKGDETPEGIYSMEVKSILEPYGFIEQTLNVEALEAGEYILRASSSFRVEKKKYHLKSEDVLVMIEDK